MGLTQKVKAGQRRIGLRARKIKRQTDLRNDLKQAKRRRGSLVDPSAISKADREISRLEHNLKLH